MIYFIVQGTEYVKIGYGNDVESRLSNLQVGNPNELYIAVCFPGSSHDEGRLHKYFDCFRVRGEWFELDELVIQFIHIWVNTCNLEEAIRLQVEVLNKEQDKVINFPVMSA